jgi:antitoxin HigA-1
MTNGDCVSDGLQQVCRTWKLWIITKRNNMMTLQKAKKLGVALGALKVPPGLILRDEFMEPLGLSVRELARKMQVTPMRVSEIVRGKRGITAETALRLSTVLRTSPHFWLNLQNQYDLAQAAMRNETMPNEFYLVRNDPGLSPKPS